MNGGLVVPYDVDGLMAALNIDQDPSDKRFFIHSFKASLRTVLLHNKVKQLFPVAINAEHLREAYDNIKQSWDA